MEILVGETELEWLMIDASYIKVHSHGTGAKETIKRLIAQKGTQYEATSHRGCTW